MIKENLPTPFGIFLEANAKHARGCWHELWKRGSLSSSLTLSYSHRQFHRYRHAPRVGAVPFNKTNGAFRQKKSLCLISEFSLSNLANVALKHFTETGCPAVLVTGNVLIMSLQTRATQGQPKLSSSTDWHTGCYAVQGQPDNLFRNTCFIQYSGRKHYCRDEYYTLS